MPPTRNTSCNNEMTKAPPPPPSSSAFATSSIKHNRKIHVLITIGCLVALRIFLTGPFFVGLICSQSLNDGSATITSKNTLTSPKLKGAITKSSKTRKKEPPSNVMSSSPNFVVLVTCSYGFYAMWENWLKFFERLQIPRMPVHLFAEDNQTYYKCLEQSDEAKRSVRNDKSGEDGYVVELKCLSWDTVFSEDTMEDNIKPRGYRSEGYIRMMSHRPAIVQRELELGYDVIFSDVDAIWVKDPLPYFQNEFSPLSNYPVSTNFSTNMAISVDSLAKSQEFTVYHIWAQKDGEKDFGKYGKQDYLCPGFMVYRSCPETITLVDRWRKELEAKEQRNQRMFNNLLWEAVAGGIMVEAPSYLSNLSLSKYSLYEKRDFLPRTLPTDLFVNGDVYFKEMNDEERSKVVLAHNTGISGFENKVIRFKKFGLWDDSIKVPFSEEGVTKKIGKTSMLTDSKVPTEDEPMEEISTSDEKFKQVKKRKKKKNAQQ